MYSFWQFGFGEKIQPWTVCASRAPKWLEIPQVGETKTKRNIYGAESNEREKHTYCVRVRWCAQLVPRYISTIFGRVHSRRARVRLNARRRVSLNGSSYGIKLGRCHEKVCGSISKLGWYCLGWVSQQQGRRRVVVLILLTRRKVIGLKWIIEESIPYAVRSYRYPTLSIIE